MKTSALHLCDIREILQAFAQADKLARYALHDDGDFDRLVRIMIAIEIRAASEIALLYLDDNPDVPEHCDTCRLWTMDGVCLCEPLSADEKAVLNEDNWGAEDLNAGIPSRA